MGQSELKQVKIFIQTAEIQNIPVFPSQIYTNFKGAIQINSIMNELANIPFLWKNPVNVSCK